jgi:hypothetical protein
VGRLSGETDHFPEHEDQSFNKYTVAEDTYKLVSGNMKRRALGVFGFGSGVIVQTIANLAGNGTI